MSISRQDWERVLEKACEIANATDSESDPMYEVHVESIKALLDELEAKHGAQSKILATRGDYLESFSERRALYEQALDLARNEQDIEAVEDILDSLNQLSEEEVAERGVAPNGGPATWSGDSEVSGGPPSVT